MMWPKLSCRSLLFVPSHIEKMMNKAISLDADCIVLDLEDAVPGESKETARIAISQALADEWYGGYRTFVRVNPIDTGLTLIDLMATASKNLRGYIYPMARSCKDVEAFASQLGLIEHELSLPNGHFTIIALIETPSGLANVEEIASAPRVEGLLFGCEDYLAEMRASHLPDHSSILYARSRISNAARASNIVPIDTPFVRIRELDEMRTFAEVGRSIGMDGMLVLSPSQIDVANQVFGVNHHERERIELILEAEKLAREKGRGVILLEDGMFISPPTLKWAKNLNLKIQQTTQWTEMRNSPGE